MGKRGPKSKADGGYGHVTKKGYRRVYDSVQKRQRMEHVLVWEFVNGPVPPGYDIHHRDDDKLNNRIDNLQLVTKTAHKRLHGGCLLVNDEWQKPCKLCGEYKSVDKANWYLSKERWPLYGRCKKCHVRRVVADRKSRRRRAQGEN
jgi:hypothetical protein